MHVLVARITFGNIFGLDAPIEGVTSVEEKVEKGVTSVDEKGGPSGGECLTCVLDRDIFEPPASYATVGASTIYINMYIFLGPHIVDMMGL